MTVQSGTSASTPSRRTFLTGIAAAAALPLGASAQPLLSNEPKAAGKRAYSKCKQRVDKNSCEGVDSRGDRRRL